MAAIETRELTKVYRTYKKAPGLWGAIKGLGKREYEDVRAAAKDWKTFSSNAPFRVPIPSEEDVRTMRQLPVETMITHHFPLDRASEAFELMAGGKSGKVIIDVSDALAP